LLALAQAGLVFRVRGWPIRANSVDSVALEVLGATSPADSPVLADEADPTAEAVVDGAAGQAGVDSPGDAAAVVLQEAGLVGLEAADPAGLGAAAAVVVAAEDRMDVADAAGRRTRLLSGIGPGVLPTRCALRCSLRRAIPSWTHVRFR